MYGVLNKVMIQKRIQN